MYVFPTTLCLWVFFSTSLQEHTDTKVGNCVFKRPSGGGTQVGSRKMNPAIYILNRCILSIYILNRCIFVFDLPAVLSFKNRPNHHALRFSHFSHNTLFVGLLFYIPARAHRHKGRKLRFQEAQRRRHTGSCYCYGCTPHLHIKSLYPLHLHIKSLFVSICQPS